MAKEGSWGWREQRQGAEDVGEVVGYGIRGLLDEKDGVHGVEQGVVARRVRIDRPSGGESYWVSKTDVAASSLCACSSTSMGLMSSSG